MIGSVPVLFDIVKRRFVRVYPFGYSSAVNAQFQPHDWFA